MQVQKPVRKCLKMGEIRLEVDLQSRVNIDQSVVGDYRDAILAGEKLPAVHVVFDGIYYYLTDGFHRFHATKAAGIGEIDVDCLKGSLRDAKLASVGANSTHGLRRTNDDKRRAVMMLLDDEEWAAWSNEAIAKTCFVSPHTVAAVKQSHSANAESGRIYTTKHGTNAVMKVANIGKDRPPSPVRDVPPEEHKPAGLAQGTPDPDDEFLVEMDSLRDKNSELHREIDSLTATDSGLEIHRLTQLLLHAENTLKDCREQAAAREKALKWFGKQFVELRALLNAKEDKQVVAAVKLLKASKK
jgi:hypothetical protein